MKIVEERIKITKKKIVDLRQKREKLMKDVEKSHRKKNIYIY